MTRLKNNNRIDKICAFVDKNPIAEIGADHANITHRLFENRQIDFAYVTDISKKCLNKAHLKLKKYSKNVVFLVGDGVEVFSNFDYSSFGLLPPKQIIIAGMGGQEIMKILQQKPSKNFDNFVLQPQNNVVQLRLFLQKNKFYIQEDVIAKDNKMFYNVLKVKRDNQIQNLSRLQILFGLTNLTEIGQDFKDYVRYKKSLYKDILSKKEVAEIREEYDLLEKIDLGE